MKNLLSRSSRGVAALGLLAMFCATGAGADRAVVRPLDADSSVFGGTQVKRIYRVEGEAGQSAVLGWSLVADRRTLLRGETPFTIQSNGIADVSVPIAVPPVNEGVVLQAELRVSLYGRGIGGDAVTHQQRISIFPRNAFGDRSRWLRSLEIVLFDPRGETAGVLEQAGIPYRQANRPEELASAGALAVVGEGLSIDEHAGLADAAFAAAQQGTSVLWLAPAAGRVPLPGAHEYGGESPSAMAFRDLSVIAELDGKLDREMWTASAPTPRTMAVRCHQDRVVVEIGTDEEGWPWFQVQYAEPAATLVLFGLPLIARWEESPTPRFLLLRVFEHLHTP